MITQEKERLWLALAVSLVVHALAFLIVQLGDWRVAPMPEFSGPLYVEMETFEEEPEPEEGIAQASRRPSRRPRNPPPRAGRRTAGRRAAAAPTRTGAADARGSGSRHSATAAERAARPRGARGAPTGARRGADPLAGELLKPTSSTLFDGQREPAGTAHRAARVRRTGQLRPDESATAAEDDSPRLGHRPTRNRGGCRHINRGCQR